MSNFVTNFGGFVGYRFCHLMLGVFFVRNFHAGSVSFSLAIKFCNRTASQYPTLQGRPGGSQKGAKSRYSVNLEMAKALNVWCSHSSRFRCVHVL